MVKVRSPLNWYGGKFRLADTLIEEITSIPHDTYIEGFGGAGQVIFAKPASKVDVYNDIHPGLFNFFSVLREQPVALETAITLTPYARQEFINCQEWASANTPLEKARQFYVTVHQSFASLLNNWSYGIGTIRRGMSVSVSRWLTNVEVKLPLAAGRLNNIHLENMDFADLIAKYDAPGTLFYLDPPYVPATRVSPNEYNHEMTYADHERLVEILKTIRGSVILSGYDNDLYDTLGWEKKIISVYTTTFSKQGERGTSRTEVIWVKRND